MLSLTYQVKERLHHLVVQLGITHKCGHTTTDVSGTNSEQLFLHILLIDFWEAKTFLNKIICKNI